MGVLHSVYSVSHKLMACACDSKKKNKLNRVRLYIYIYIYIYRIFTYSICVNIDSVESKVLYCTAVFKTSRWGLHIRMVIYRM